MRYGQEEPENKDACAAEASPIMPLMREYKDRAGQN